MSIQTTAPDYVPLPGSLAARVLDYFAKNPEEELSSRDIALKFEVSAASNVSPSLTTPIVHELITRIPGGAYAPGPRFQSWKRAQQAAPMQAQLQAQLQPIPAQKQTRPRNPPAPPLDIDAIPIHPGIVRPRSGSTGLRPESLKSQIKKIFERMTPNSHVCLSAVYRHTAGDELTRWRKAHPDQSWSIRIDTDQITINRHA